MLRRLLVVQRNDCLDNSSTYPIYSRLQFSAYKKIASGSFVHPFFFGTSNFPSLSEILLLFSSQEIFKKVSRLMGIPMRGRREKTTRVSLCSYIFNNVKEPCKTLLSSTTYHHGLEFFKTDFAITIGINFIHHGI